MANLCALLLRLSACGAVCMPLSGSGTEYFCPPMRAEALALETPIAGLSPSPTPTLPSLPASSRDSGREPRPYQTIPDNKLGTTLRDLFAQTPDSLIATLSSPDNRCDSMITERFQDSYIALVNGNLFMTAQQVLQKRVSAASLPTTKRQKIERFIEHTRQLLDHCYIPAETSGFSRSHQPLTMLGALYEDHMPLCTALMIDAQGTLLTARHCFSTELAHGARQPRRNLWFKPALTNDSWQVCSILEPRAQAPDKFRNARDDQVLARIAGGHFITQALEVPPAREIKTLADDSHAPTLLVQISLFPLARLIMPERFKSGFVQGISPSCIALHKEDRCFTHTCNAIPGGSGAAIFLHTSSALALVGTHLGGAVESGDCQTPQRLQLNGGAFIREHIRQTIKTDHRSHPE